MSWFKSNSSDVETQPTKPAPLNIFDQALASANDTDIPIGNFMKVAKDQSFEELFELAGIAKEKGLKGQVKHIGRRIIATALEKQGMSLLATRIDRKGDIDITRIHADGTREDIRSPGSNGEWRAQSLAGYEMYMPDKVLRDIPGDVVSQGKIFIPKADSSFFVTKDPIIAVHIYQAQAQHDYSFGYDFYIGMFKWD